MYNKMDLANPFATLCLPAQYFLILIFVDVIYVAFFKKSKKNLSLTSRSMVFFFILMCSIGWSFVINYACGYEENVAWVFAAIPILYLAFRSFLKG